ncbi:hypothetical protein AB4212_59080, partial [Streptomyces sp. 2MCAF27]
MVDEEMLDEAMLEEQGAEHAAEQAEQADQAGRAAPVAGARRLREVLRQGGEAFPAALREADDGLLL